MKQDYSGIIPQNLDDEEHSGEIASTGYCVLRADKNKIFPKWIFYHLSSTDFLTYVEENQSGSAYPAISDAKVKDFSIPIPYADDPQKSLAEQERIINILDKTIDTLKAHCGPMSRYALIIAPHGVKQKNVLLDSKDKRYRSYMMHVGSKLVFYSLSVAIFTKTSQIFLGLKSAYDLGIYTVAAALGTSFYFVLVALISSFMTDIYQEKSLEESQKKVARLNALVIFISIGAFVFFLLFGQWIIKVLYGEQFQQAAQIILWMVVVCLFSGLSTVAEKYLLKFNAYSYLQKKTNVLVVFNIVLAFLIIQAYGVYGAVFAILVTEILSTTVFNYFFKNNIIFDTHRRIFLSSTYKKAGA